MKADLTQEVDLEFTKVGFQMPPMPKSVEDVPFVSCSDRDEDNRSIPSSNVLVSQTDLEKLGESLFQHIQMEEKINSSPFHKETENLHGDREGDLLRLQSDPNLKTLLGRFLDIFGPLPPPGAGCQLVQCDLELKE